MVFNDYQLQEKYIKKKIHQLIMDRLIHTYRLMIMQIEFQSHVFFILIKVSVTCHLKPLTCYHNDIIFKTTL